MVTSISLRDIAIYFFFLLCRYIALNDVVHHFVRRREVWRYISIFINSLITSRLVKFRNSSVTACGDVRVRLKVEFRVAEHGLTSLVRSSKFINDFSVDFLDALASDTLTELGEHKFAVASVAELFSNLRVNNLSRAIVVDISVQDTYLLTFLVMKCECD